MQLPEPRGGYEAARFHGAYNGRMSIVPVLIAATVIVGPIALYFAGRFREVRKFLAGAFFVSAGMQMYFSQIGLSIPRPKRVSCAQAFILFFSYCVCISGSSKSRRLDKYESDD
jgi:hypothetical protein